MKSKKDIQIIGAFNTQIGELWDKSLEDLLEEAVEGALTDSGLEGSEIEAIFVANKAGGEFNNQLHLNAIASGLFDHYPPALRVEGACASGGLAVLAAEHALLAGVYQTVMVVGAEKMTDVGTALSTEILGMAAWNKTEYGSTFPGLYALLAQAHMKRYQTTRNQLSAVAVKNHRHALDNKKAQFHREFSLKQVSNSSLVADPLRLLDCSPISDGAAGLVLTTKQTDSGSKVRVTGFGHAQDSLDLAHRKDLTQLGSTQKAAKKAYQMAGIKPSQIEAAEVHDCFTIAEILAIEDLGLVKKGAGGRATETGETSWGSKVVVNPSGGLKAFGHPIGATGVKQLVYLSNLIRSGKISTGLAHNVGGSGATAVVHVLEKGK